MMGRIGAVLLLFFLAVWAAECLIPVPAHSAVNPFTSGRGGTGQARDADDGKTAAPGASSILAPVLNQLSLLQMEARQRMTGFARDIKEDPWSGAFWLFMLLAFAYGAMHALGPGHGKLFAASYFLNRPGGFRAALLFGNLTMFFHVLSATLAVLAGYFLLNTGAAGGMEAMSGGLEAASYGLLCLLGLGMTGKTLLDFLRDRRGGDAVGGIIPQKTGDNGLKSLVAMALAAGMVPCPGAALVLTFSLALGIFGAGLLAMVSISLGMGLTISAVACLAVCSRGFILGLASRHGRIFRAAHLSLSLAGSLAIALLGGLLLFGALA